MLAHLRIFSGPNPRRKPDTSLFIHHRIVIECFAIPDRFGAPVRGCAKRTILRRRRVRITYGMQDFSRGVRFRIENGYQIRAVLGRCINLAIRIHSRIATVGRDLIMEVSGRSAPVPQCDHKIALDSLRPLGFREGQLTAGDTIGPIGKIFERNFRIESRDVAGHECPCPAGLEAPPPSLHGIRECAELLRNRSHPLCAQGVARLAGSRFDDVQPFTLALYLLQWELAALRHPKQRKPVKCRIILRRLRRCGRDHGLQVHGLARRGVYFRRVDESVTSHPNVVIPLRKLRYQITALIISDHNFRELGWKIRCLGNHPHTRFGSLRSRNNPTDITVSDGHNTCCVLLTADLNRLKGEKNCYRYRHQGDMNGPSCSHVRTPSDSDLQFIAGPTDAQPSAARQVLRGTWPPQCLVPACSLPDQ